MTPPEAAEFLSHGEAGTDVIRIVKLCSASPLALSIVKTTATETCRGTGNRGDWRRMAGLLDKAAKAMTVAVDGQDTVVRAAMTVAVDGLDTVVRACYESLE